MQPAFSKIFFKCFKMFLCLKNKVNPSSLTYSDDDHVPKNSQNSFKKEPFFLQVTQKSQIVIQQKELSLCKKILIFQFLYLFNPVLYRPLIIQTMNYVELNIQSLKYQSGCRDLCIRNFEFVAKTHFLCWNNGGRSRTKFNKFNSTSFQLLMNTKFNSTIFEKLCCQVEFGSSAPTNKFCQMKFDTCQSQQGLFFIYSRFPTTANLFVFCQI